LALTLLATMPVKVNSIDSGITMAVIRPRGCCRGTGTAPR
jgi:hypothetical protein